MSNSIVKLMDKLVQDRVGRSRAQLIEDAVRWYLDFTVHKCTPVEQYELGETAGSQAPVADVVRLFHGKNIRDITTRELAFQLLQDSGWGEISLHDDLIVIGGPFYPAPFIRGYLESLFKTKLELVETNVKENVALREKR
jgi:hypothetical protein